MLVDPALFCPGFVHFSFGVHCRRRFAWLALTGMRKVWGFGGRPVIVGSVRAPDISYLKLLDDVS